MGNEIYNLKISPEPTSFYLDLDQPLLMGNPIKDFRVIVSGETFIFTKEQIYGLLKKLQEINHEK